MRKRLIYSLLFLLVIILASCKDTKIESADTTAQKIIDLVEVKENNTTIDADFTLPASITYNSVSYSITWTSNNQDILTFTKNSNDYTAKVIQGTSDTVVSFSASINYQGITKSKSFSVTIAKKAEDKDAIASQIINLVVVDKANTTISSDFTLPASVTYQNVSYPISWTSNNTLALTFTKNANDYTAKIVQSQSDTVVSFSASITYQGLTKSKNFSITIAKVEGTTPDPEPGTLPSELTYTGYYADLTGNFANFFTVMNDILVTTHTNHLTYGEVWSVLAESDAYDENNIECFYTGRLIPKEDRDGSSSSSLVWNREHVWAKSHGFNNESYTAYSDAHHLRATEKVINSSRNNSYFDEITGTANSDNYGNKWTNDVFEPRDEVKGDVARILFYMVTRYHDSELTLTLDNSGSYGNEPTLGMLDTLVKWHYEDPVSETEIKRNEVVYQYQGNRNPYIDHPEFVYYLYQEESEALGVTEANVLEKVESHEEEDTTIPTLINDIEALRNKTITVDDKTLLDSLKARYDALSPADKTKVTNYDLLQAKINEYNTLLGIRTVIYDFAAFPGNGTSYVKEETTVTINDVSFTASNHGTGAGFILGANTKNYTEPNSKYNVGNWSKYSILEFNVADLSEIAFTVSKLYSGINECHILYSANGLTYTEEWSFKPVEGEEFFYDFSTPTTGYFVILVEGSQPRMGIANFTLKYITK